MTSPSRPVTVGVGISVVEIILEVPGVSPSQRPDVTLGRHVNLDFSILCGSAVALVGVKRPECLE